MVHFLQVLAFFGGTNILANLAAQKLAGTEALGRLRYSGLFIFCWIGIILLGLLILASISVLTGTSPRKFV
jgi:hypothetical protein